MLQPYSWRRGPVGFRQRQGGQDFDAAQIAARHRDRDRGAGATWQCAVIARSAPELRAILVRPEAITADWQRQRRLPRGIGGLVVAGIGRVVDGINRQRVLWHTIRIQHRHRHWNRNGDRRACTTWHGAVIACPAS